jgi:hypothetical protein
MSAREGSLSLRVFTFVNESFLKTLFHEIFFRHRPVAKLLWGITFPPLLKDLPFGQGFSDLSGIVLRSVLVRWVRSRGLRRVHEIGIGHYAIQCIYLRKRFPSLSLSGSTISPVEVENSTKTAQMNGAQIPFYVSDLLADFTGGPVEMLWWNLPYYDPRMQDWLRRLFHQVHEKKALVDKGLLVLATNTVPLRAETIETLAKGYTHLRLVEIKRHSWNPHAVLTFEYLERH